jgi:predicted RNA methylase
MAKAVKKITSEVLGVISRLVVEQGPMAWVARITDGQLDRKVYVAFNEAVETLGGKWHKGAKGHIFSHDPSEEIEALLITGEFRTKFSGDFFQTPPELAQRMVAWAVRPGDLVLEPSAGHGRIATEALKIAGDQRVICIEIDADRALRLPAGCDVRCCDFLGVSPFPVDAVVMNPPFSKSQECAHILHAMKFLRRGGRLASVASNGVTFRETAAYKELRATLAEGGDIEQLPPGVFREEGTGIPTVLITWVKP